MKNCIRLRLLTISEDLNVQSNVSYYFIRGIAGEAVGEREERRQKGNWQDEAMLWPWMQVLLLGTKSICFPQPGHPTNTY